jgi:hypothetical protein
LRIVTRFGGRRNRCRKTPSAIKRNVCDFSATATHPGSITAAGFTLQDLGLTRLKLRRLFPGRLDQSDSGRDSAGQAANTLIWPRYATSHHHSSGTFVFLAGTWRAAEGILVGYFLRLKTRAPGLVTSRLCYMSAPQLFRVLVKKQFSSWIHGDICIRLDLFTCTCRPTSLKFISAWIPADAAGAAISLAWRQPVARTRTSARLAENGEGERKRIST